MYVVVVPRHHLLSRLSTLGLRAELTKVYVMNYMPINFQLSSLINEKSFEKGDPSAPRKGRFAVHKRVDPHACISILYMHTKFQLSILINNKVGAFVPMQRPFRGPQVG